MKILKLFLFLLWILPLNLTGQKMALDKSFGNEGVTSIPDIEEIKVIEIDQNGNIFIVGKTPENKILLAKINSEGAPDNSFGEKGIIDTKIIDGAITLSRYTSYKIAVQSDNKVLLGGTAYMKNESSASMFLIRYNANGIVDELFGNEGIVNFPCDSDNNPFNTGKINAILALPDHSIILSKLDNYLSKAVTTVKLNERGIPDKQFQDNISTKMLFFSTYKFLLLSDGTILCSGSNRTFIEPEFGCFKIDQRGNNIASFKNNNSSSEIWEGAKAIEQKDKKILVKGDGYLLRFDPNGLLDESFSNKGILKNFGYQDYTLLDNGKIVSCKYDASIDKYVLVQLNSQGETEFICERNVYDMETVSNKIRFQSNNKFITAGIESKYGQNKLVILRTEWNNITSISYMDTNDILVYSLSPKNVTIESKTSFIQSIKIIGTDGNLLFAKNYPEHNNIQIINDLSFKGMIIIKVTLYTGQTISEKFIVQ